MEINKTVIVASRWFLFYLTYIDDARSNTNQVDYSVFQVGVYRSDEVTRGISPADVGSDDEDVDDMLVETVL